MRTIKINQKSYNVPEFGFAQMRAMEDNGFNVVEIVTKQKIFSIASAFVSVVVGCNAKDADILIEQHILGGGNIMDLCEAFAKATEESSFFKSLFGSKAEQNQTGQKPQIVK